MSCPEWTWPSGRRRMRSPRSRVDLDDRHERADCGDPGGSGRVDEPRRTRRTSRAGASTSRVQSSADVRSATPVATIARDATSRAAGANDVHASTSVRGARTRGAGIGARPRRSQVPLACRGPDTREGATHRAEVAMCDRSHTWFACNRAPAPAPTGDARRRKRLAISGTRSARSATPYTIAPAPARRRARRSGRPGRGPSASSSASQMKYETPARAAAASRSASRDQISRPSSSRPSARAGPGLGDDARDRRDAGRGDDSADAVRLVEERARRPR